MKLTKATTAKGYPYWKFSAMEPERAAAFTDAKQRVQDVHNTWKHREEEEKIRDIAVGMLAHSVVEEVLKAAGLSYLSYEATRIDERRNDDPFDFLLLPPDYDQEADLIDWLQTELYPGVNSQGRLRKAVRLLLKERLNEEGLLVADLKSSVDNRGHGVDALVHEQHHIAYATQKNDAGFRVISGRQYLDELGLSVEDYIDRKNVIKDVHFRVFFADVSLETALYVGFTFGRDLVLEGDVGPFPGMPWVLYHRQKIEDCYQPGGEKEIFGK